MIISHKLLQKNLFMLTNNQKNMIKKSLLGETSIEVAELSFQILVLGVLILSFFAAFTSQNGWGAMFVIIPIMFFNYFFQITCSFYHFIFNSNNLVKILSFLHLLFSGLYFLPIGRIFGINEGYTPNWLYNYYFIYIFSLFVFFLMIILLRLNLAKKFK